jgi:site-specific DNA-methyltransferase (adenine-specific)
MSYKLLNGDCLELMKAIPDNSIDLIFTDLPYADNKGYSAVSCKWNTPVDLEQMWIQYLRIKKKNTPIFFTTTTKFGVNLINSAPKKCFFRYDLVWVKSASAGFLNSRRAPLRKHELIYVFYEKVPLYDLSSHKHKFIKDGTKSKEDNCYGVQKLEKKKQYDPPLPTSIIKEEKFVGKPIMRKNTTYGDIMTPEIKERKGGESRYDPPLPTSILEVKSQRSKHSTQKPVDLMKYIFKYYSKEGDMILDNCMGSGSTGVAALQMNRNFIGIELDKDIFKVAQDRLKNKL